MSLVLAVNAGSSSLKISLFRRSAEDATNPVLLLSSSMSSIFSSPAKFKFSLVAHRNSSLNEQVDSICDHASAFTHFLNRLKEEASIDRTDIKHIAHRVVHGGDYTGPIIISEESYHYIEGLSDLAPLYVVIHSLASSAALRRPVDTMGQPFRSSRLPSGRFRTRSRSHSLTAHFISISQLM